MFYKFKIQPSQDTFHSVVLRFPLVVTLLVKPSVFIGLVALFVCFLPNTTLVYPTLDHTTLEPPMFEHATLKPVPLDPATLALTLRLSLD